MTLPHLGFPQVSTIITSPGGTAARAHGDRPMTPLEQEVVGKAVDAAVLKMLREGAADYRVERNRKGEVVSFPIFTRRNPFCAP